MRQRLRSIARSVQVRARARRAELFRSHFDLSQRTTVLDVGSEAGSNIAMLIDGTEIQAKNVTIADISRSSVEEGAARYGFNACVLSGDPKLPFRDQEFDIVYCSSVIEHVTVPKESVWSCRDSRDFRSYAQAAQREFAEELRRVGLRYFVQTPNRYFPIESHTWLPLMGIVPRELLVPALRLTNRYWIKSTAPDWHLLTIKDMRALFPDGKLRFESFGGLKKSIIAMRT